MGEQGLGLLLEGLDGVGAGGPAENALSRDVAVLFRLDIRVCGVWAVR